MYGMHRTSFGTLFMKLASQNDLKIYELLNYFERKGGVGSIQQVVVVCHYVLDQRYSTGRSSEYFNNIQVKARLKSFQGTMRGCLLEGMRM